MSAQEKSMKSTSCCPRFDPDLWDKKTFHWDSKLFLKDNVRTVWFVPLNFGSVMRHMNNLADKAGARILDGMCLSEHVSKWNMNVYCAVDKKIPNAEHITLSGRFFSKVYEGSFKETGEWCKDFERVAKNVGMTFSQTYMWYTTCPKCAKVYGKNYVVFIGHLGEGGERNG